MIKKQKILLGIFLALFLVPEILWSPVGNFIYSVFQSGSVHPKVLRPTFLQEYRYEKLLITILFMELISLILASGLVIRLKNVNKYLRVIGAIVLILSLLSFALLFYFLFLFNIEIL